MDEINTSASNFIYDFIDEDLKNGVNTRVQTRFPPEPNGYLHIGHAKAICIDFSTAEKYGGECNLRLDDTNPSKEDVEYVDAIKEDIEWLGYKWNKVLYASSYFDFIYECAIKLIKKGKAYVCDLSADEIREYRGTLTEPGKNSPYRERSIEENLDLFARMTAGEFKDGEKTLRAKIDMSSPNINMRDPVIYRIAHIHHHQTGDKWCVYPMYDFAHPLSDAKEGVTYSLCSLEFENHRPLYDWFIKEIGFDEPPRQIEFARLNINYCVTSKRKCLEMVKKGIVDGWDDPRMVTLCGMRRRGYPAAAIREFINRIGVSKAYSVVDYGLLEACVRDNLNANAPRAMAVLRPLKVIIDNYPEGQTEAIEVEINPDDLKIDYYRSSGAGGQKVNKTSSAVRITHIPTGIVCACQVERSQHQNREVAMKMLKSKLIEIKEREHLDKIDDIKGEQREIAWGSQIRSYVFMPYTLAKDHRTGFESGNINAVMDGDIDGFINAYLKMESLKN